MDRTFSGDSTEDLTAKKLPFTSTPISGKHSGVKGGYGEGDVEYHNSDDRDRSQHRKMKDLTSQNQKLEESISLLRAENEVLKKSQDQSPAEEKIKKLKKRNAELAAIARRLEEKAKQLQQENLKKSKDSGNGSQDVDHVKRVFARQRAKDLAEHAKVMLAKDKEVETLRKKCQDLADQLSNSITNAGNSGVFEDREELETIIKQAARERLLLERQVAMQSKQGSRSPSRNSDLNRSNVVALEEENQSLRREIELAEVATRDLEKLEIEVTQRRIESESLYKKLEEKNGNVSKLEDELRVTIQKNNQLSQEVLDLETKLQQLEEKLTEAQNAEADNSHLLALEETNKALRRELEKSELEQSKLQESFEENTHALHERLEKLEKDYHHKCKESEESVKRAQEEVEATHRAERERDRLRSELNIKISEFEDVKSLLKEQQGKSLELQGELETQILKNTELTKQTTELYQKLQDFEKITEECQTLRASVEVKNSECKAAKEEISTLQKRISELEPLEQLMQAAKEKQKELDAAHKEALNKLQEKEQLATSLQKEKDEASKESQNIIESLQGKIEALEKQCELQSAQHNDLLKELSMLKLQAEAVAKTTKVSAEVQVDLETSPPSAGKLAPQKPPRKKKIAMKRDLIDELEGSSWEHILIADETDKSVSVRREVNDLEDNELADIAEKIKVLALSDSEEEMHEEEEEEEKTKIQEHSKMKDHTEDSKEKAELQEIEKILKAAEPTSEADNPSLRIPNLLKKTGVQVFVAKYSYDPVKYSPNENPEAELALNAGDYVYVSGGVDEDGFYDGELMDGRRGLVPSNFVEKVTDDELEALHTALMAGTSDQDSSFDNSLQQELDFNSSDESEKISMETDLPEDIHALRNVCDLPDSDLEDIEEVDEENLTQTDKSDLTNLSGGSGERRMGVPAPRKLTLERQLSNSIVVGWSPPDHIKHTDIQAYHVYVDGHFKTSIKGTEKTKALVEGVQANKPHRICVRTVMARGQSKDQECTIMIGKEMYDYEGKDSTILQLIKNVVFVPRSMENAALAPTELKVSATTATSAILSWYPGNSNYQHVIYLNDKEVRTVKPGVYKQTLTGLTPSTQYTAMVQAKSIKSTYEDEKNKKKQSSMSSSITFHTQAGGIPDPPLDVQVDSKLQSGSLVVTWLPVTINPSGTSNGALVTGYAVFVDGKKIKDIDGPTVDQVTISSVELSTAGQQPKLLTMRTKSHAQMSGDSVAVSLPTGQLEKQVKVASAKTIAAEAAQKVAEKKKAEGGMYAGASDSDEGSSDDINKELYKPTTLTAIKPTHKPAVLEGSDEDAGKTDNKKPIPTVLFRAIEDSSQSELSDITEEEEGAFEEADEEEEASDSFLDIEFPGLGDSQKAPLPAPLLVKGATSDKEDRKKHHGQMVISPGPKPTFGVIHLTDDQPPFHTSTPKHSRDRDRHTKTPAETTGRKDKEVHSEFSTSPLAQALDKEHKSGQKHRHGSLSRESSIDQEETKGRERSGSKSKKDKSDGEITPRTTKDKERDQTKVTPRGSRHGEQREHKGEHKDKHLREKGVSKDKSDQSPKKKEGHKTKEKEEHTPREKGEKCKGHKAICQRQESPIHKHKEGHSPRKKEGLKEKKEHHVPSEGGEHKHVDKKDHDTSTGKDKHHRSDHTHRDVTGRTLQEKRSTSADAQPAKEDSLGVGDIGVSISPGEVRGSSRSTDGSFSRTPHQFSVPSIEITKDSGSSEEEGNYSDDEFESYSSDNVSSGHSPRYGYSPSIQGKAQPKGTQHQHKPGSDTKYGPGMDKRDGYRERKEEPINTQSLDQELASSLKRAKEKEKPTSGTGVHKGEERTGMDSSKEKRKSSASENLSRSSIRDDIPESELIDYEDDGEGESLEENAEEMIPEGPVRLFIALFDYDPEVMSPNPGAAAEELPFKEGQLIKVYGEADEDGFFHGESGGRFGYVPGNMVSEISLEDQDVADGLLEQSMSHKQDSNQLPGGREQAYDVTPDEKHDSNGYLIFPKQGPARKMIALYDYDPEELSPNVDADEVELAFSAGQIILVYGEMDEDGFFLGELNGRQGLVPSNFLEDLREDEGEEIGTPVVQNSGSALEDGTPKKDKKEKSGSPQKDGKKDKDVSSPIATGDESKEKKKKGFFSKGKSIFKKLKR
ncbi:LOW QUALITY PROTEIN: peripheral-type benzodiazepine receptor-associated protein 1-like [Lingula anatina]|uniref:LOW QUALITY PROTEIN: peripheral-type benzodiazepine receptor-associated protein 1-like n=1 Tax=Lingula anatina TaxID=7574 RepID=A0A1S3JUH8_LINAN|nr:LOW QUALITY PROTEIN: peripheral-type benzodiazepine receptor-associated protein 1-like [Lingula anatina]|eukprot:XP_013413977.1 LOW QUALITY PROTEIN: peripheral-type benzodiazepine receptor-associated protein 1-like [Lingula anatina]